MKQKTATVIGKNLLRTAVMKIVNVDVTKSVNAAVMKPAQEVFVLCSGHLDSREK
jgi:hypothetical protein